LEEKIRIQQQSDGQGKEASSHLLAHFVVEVVYAAGISNRIEHFSYAPFLVEEHHFGLHFTVHRIDHF